MTRGMDRSAQTMISSKDVQGTPVYGPSDNARIGTIDSLMIEKVSGRVIYAIMSFGGFLGLGQSLYPIPWAALKYDRAVNGYRTGITEEQLKHAPNFAGETLGDRDWELRTHRHYGVDPYWQGSYAKAANDYLTHRAPDSETM